MRSISNTEISRSTLIRRSFACFLIFLALSVPAYAVAPAQSTLTHEGVLVLDGEGVAPLKESVSVTVGLKRKAPEVRYLGVEPTDGKWVTAVSFFQTYLLISRANGADTYGLQVTFDRDASTHLGGTPGLRILDLEEQVLSEVTLGATAVLVPAEAGATEVTVPNDLTPTDVVVNGISVGDLVVLNNHPNLYRVGAVTPSGDKVVLALTLESGGEGLAEAVDVGDLIAEAAEFRVEISGDLHSTHGTDSAKVTFDVTAKVSSDPVNLSATARAEVVVPPSELIAVYPEIAVDPDKEQAFLVTYLNDEFTRAASVGEAQCQENLKGVFCACFGRSAIFKDKCRHGEEKTGCIKKRDTYCLEQLNRVKNVCNLGQFGKKSCKSRMSNNPCNDGDEYVHLIDAACRVAKKARVGGMA